MAPIVHGFDWPDRLVVGTVGQPGERTFYLQARAGKQLVSVAMEKQQSAALADGIDALLAPEIVSPIAEMERSERRRQRVRKSSGDAR